MIEKDILDEPIAANSSANKFEPAIIAVLVLAILLFLNFHTWYQWQFLLFGYASITGVLYFFYKKLKHVQFNNGELFFWGTGIVFFSTFLSNIVLFFMDQIPFVHSTSDFIAYHFEILLLSIVLGYLISIGVVEYIKNKNWAMLILMIISSLIMTSIFIY